MYKFLDCMYNAIVWDERNLRHLLVENASRGIEPWQVEEVLRSPHSQVRRLRRGRAPADVI